MNVPNEFLNREKREALKPQVKSPQVSLAILVYVQYGEKRKEKKKKIFVFSYVATSR